MSRTITAIAIFIVIIGLAIFESAYTINVSEQVKNELSTALEEFLDENQEQAEKHIENAEKIWQENTTVLDAFLVHDDTETIADEISYAKNTLKYNNGHFPIECEKAIDSLKIIIYTMIPFLDNIL